MPSAAGDASVYEFVLRDSRTGRYDRERSIKLDRVTTVISRTLAKPQLYDWYYRETRDAISGLASVVGDHEDFLDVMTDAQMLDEYLKENKLRPEDTVDRRAEEGTKHHGFLQTLADYSLDPECPDGYVEGLCHKTLANVRSKPSYNEAIAAWWLQSERHIVSSEETLFSLQHGFAGTVDLVWKPTAESDILVITDLKTRGADKVAYESDFIQTGAYAVAYREMYGADLHITRSVLVAREDGSFTEYEATVDETAFLDLLSAYRKLRRR